jgi:hypothetical protein
MAKAPRHFVQDKQYWHVKFTRDLSIVSKRNKTRTWTVTRRKCRGQQAGDILGMVKWCARWHGYAFIPGWAKELVQDFPGSCVTVIMLNEGPLREILDFGSRVNAEHKTMLCDARDEARARRHSEEF